MVKGNNPKISVIIPVYNTGEFLRGCIESVMSQTLKEWELILIDDGSRDNSGLICDEYAQKDERIRVLHKKNEGVSIARNTGLKMATGEFIGFIDSDDTIKPEMYERLYTKAIETSAQIVMCDAVTVYKDQNIEPDTITQLEKSCSLNKDNFTPELLMEMAGAAWRCIYSRELIQNNSIGFPVGHKFSEDRIFNIYAFGFANKVCYIKEAFYNRLIWDGSAVNRFHRDYFDAAKKAEQTTTRAIKEAWEDKQEYQSAYKIQFITAAIAAVNNYFYKTSTLTLKEKYNVVKALCNDEQLVNAIKYCDSEDIRIRLLKKRRTILLSLSAILANIRYGR